DDMAARLERLAAPADRLEAEKMVARGADLEAARAGEIAGDDAADGLAAGRRAEQPAVVGGLEGEALPLLGERRLDLDKAGAGGGRQHQLLGRIADDAGESIERQLGARLHRPAERPLGAGAAHLERRAGGGRLGDGG